MSIAGLETAFALAGLGGFNAHGAGFLTAARECGVVPDLVTATSGQIVVLADWLQGKDLETALVDPALEHNPLAQLAVALSGDPGVFMPAYKEALARWFTPPRSGEKPLDALFDRLLPAQQYVPTRPAADFVAIANTLNAAQTKDGKPIAIVFNAYDFRTGQAALFGNDAARRHWPNEKAITTALATRNARYARSGTQEAGLQPITEKAVQSSLWLTLYGFDHVPQPHLIDGAYHRSCIVSELHMFDRIFVARPLAQGWLKRPPANWFEVQDWQTEMWFSVGYKAEVDTLQQINGLVGAGHLPKQFKHVDLIEIAPETPAGYFNYFIERAAIYDRARKEAIEAFRKAGLGVAPRPRSASTRSASPPAAASPSSAG